MHITRHESQQSVKAGFTNDGRTAYRKGLFGVLNSGNEDSVINNVFSCDLLSLAMTKDLDGCAWFTVIGNVNTIAVAAHTGASCVVLCEKVKPDADALLKAQEHNIALFVSDKPVFDSAAELYAITDV